VTGETGEALRAILAGWVTGAAIGIVNLGVLMVLLAREREPMARFPGLKVSLPIFGVIVANVMVFGWTLVGIVLGFIYTLMSPGAFVAVVVAVGVFVGAAYGVLRGVAASEAKFVWPSLALGTVLFASVVPFLVEVV
jgi:hypothetical protein